MGRIWVNLSHRTRAAPIGSGSFAFHAMPAARGQAISGQFLPNVIRRAASGAKSGLRLASHSVLVTSAFRLSARSDALGKASNPSSMGRSKDLGATVLMASAA